MLINYSYEATFETPRTSLSSG